jgi:hypothetical protein
VKLRLDAVAIERIAQAPRESRAAVTGEELHEAEVIYADKEAARIFGMPEVPPTTPFGDLIRGWQDEYPKDEARWLDGLSTQVMDAARWKFPTLSWELMRGLDPRDSTWYAPVLNFVRRRDGAMEFDVYFDKFTVDPETKSVRIGSPEL